MFWKKKSEPIADKKPEFVNPDRLNDVIVLDNKNYIVIDIGKNYTVIRDENYNTRQIIYGS